tara:strand:+ start:2259 stop:3059 length:801 start_codon:yes stop_codon:yes gene_type:complete
MKKISLLLLLFIAFSACKNEIKKEDAALEVEEVSEEIQEKVYPQIIAAVFEAHGGTAHWNKMNNLCFEMDGSNGNEIHTTSLGNRLVKIENNDWAIGYDGDNVWLQQHKENAYEGNARLYHNLMFYFYAMPFILGDDGINYEVLEQRELDGKLYNATKISYDAGVGDSPEDEYILFSDPETNKMVWLAYTVTFKSGEKSDNWNFIKYDNWQDVNGLLLPEKLTWYEVENGSPKGEKRNKIFKKLTATETVLEASVFAKPEGAVIID